jgi:iron complex outermembrane receptor protein
MTVYGGWSTNTRTPTASEIECSDPLTPCLLPTNLAGDPPLLKQVVSRTTELGLRGTAPDVAGGEVSWNVSGFRTLLENDIFGIATSISQGFFQNIGDTRRQGFEAGIGYHGDRWSAFANYSFVQASFRSALTVPSPSNPVQDENGDIQVTAGDRMPGIPENRLKLGADFKIIPDWTVGAALNLVSSSFYVGDESNQLPALPGYATVNLHTAYKPFAHFEVFASITNLLNRKYSTWGILSDPTGVNAPGIPAAAESNDPGVDNRFQSPAAPFEVFGGVRLSL